MHNENRTKKVITLAMGFVLVSSLAACSTTSNVIKTSHAAPITYKVGEGSFKYASLRSPNRPTLRSTPSAPIYSAPERPKFDQSNVDRDLYAHQQVGKKYKIAGKSYKPKHDPDYDETGIASWYGDKFHGKPTASGEIYDKNDLTAAHKTLPLNSMVFVTNLQNGKTLKVRVNDRGPFIGKRIIDLSEASARTLGIIGSGLGKVRVQYAGPADPMASGRQYTPAPMPELTARGPEEAVPYVAPTPVQPRSYIPLRELPQSSAPRSAESLPMPTPRSYSPAPVLPAPIVPRPAQPVQPVTPEAEDDGITTLTIKGPVHMASNNASARPPRFIPAVNYRTYKTNK